MNQRIKKIIIPVAGLGTRFLPATKAQPKSMLPIVDKPVIQYVVEEAIASGLTDIILVTGPGKRAIEDHFDRNPELEEHLRKFKKFKELKAVQKIGNLANFIYVRQKEFYGTGFPILAAKHLIASEPFVYGYEDNIFVSPVPRFKQLIKVWKKYQKSVITAYPITEEGTKKFGVIEGEQIEKNVWQVQKLMEKPGPKRTSSRMGSLGGYIMTPEVIEILEELKKKLKKGQELFFTEALKELIKRGPVYACLVQGQHYDLGSKLGWLQANVDFSLKHPETKKEFRKYLDEKT